MVAGGGASVIYADTISDLVGEMLAFLLIYCRGLAKSLPTMESILVIQVKH